MDLTSIYNDNVLIDINNLNIFLSEKKGNIDDFILVELKKKIGNRCNKDGLVIKNSIQIIYRNCGEFKFNEKILYKIKYSADILFPTEGCLLQDCKIIFISKVLYIAKPEKLDLVILLPKKFIDESKYNIKNKINVICLDKYYEFNDKFMFIIGIPHFNNPTQEFIQDKSMDKSMNDDMCKNIYNEFQNEEEYSWINEKLFKEDKIQEIFESFDIDYNSNSSIKKIAHSNFILMKLLDELNEILKTSNECIEYQINTVNLTTYEEIFNIIELINYGGFIYNTPLYINYKNDLINFIKFDLLQYKNNLNQINTNEFILNTKKNSIENQLKDCYIISTIHILQNCKIFSKKLKTIIQNPPASLPSTYLNFLQELNYLINENNTDITEFKNILISYIENDSNIYINLNNLNNIYDFINILFYILDTNRGEDILTRYKYNVYNDILNEKNYKKYDNTNNIKYYIEKLIENQYGLLKEFYSISVNEYTCSECQFRSYHIKNKFTINIDINNYNTVANCVHHSSKIASNINGIKCPVCESISMKKKCYLYKNPQDYVLFDINRIIYESENSIKKNPQELFVNNRIHYQIINKEKSINNLVFDNYILDLKSIICHIGTISNGYYISINKNKNDLFELQLEEKNYIIRNSDFYDFSIFKKYISNVVYQINNIDNPLSDIHLLLYEDYYNTSNNPELKSFNDFIKNEVGIRVSTFTGGASSIEEVNNPLENLILSELITKKNLIVLLNDLFDNSSIDISIDDSEESLLHKINMYWLRNMKYINASINTLYNTIIIKYVTNLKKQLNTNKNQIEFLTNTPNISFLHNTINNIYIGSTGYNINKTNHWDVIYTKNSNQLDLYSEHFNSIELNDISYNLEEKINWANLKSNIENIDTENFKFSVVFNTDFSNFIMNSIFSDLETNIESEFNKYWIEQMNTIEDYIQNIVFVFNSNFEYNEDNFNKIKLLNDIIFDKYKTNINFIFEIYNNDWYNTQVSDYFIGQKLSFVSLIVNNENSDFGYNFDSETNFEFVNNKNFVVSYIKLYGSKYKYNGSHSNDLYKIIRTIKDNDLLKIDFISKINPDKKHFIYFNNLETDFNNIRYKPNELSDDETLTSESDFVQEISSVKGGSDIESIESPEDILEEGAKEEQSPQEESPQEEVQEESPQEEQEMSEESSETNLDINDKFDNTEEETSSDNMNMPSAVFDAKCLYHILEKINK